MLFSCVTRAASCSFSLRLNVWRLRRAAAIQLSGRASRTLHVLHSTSSQNGAVASLRPNDSWPRDALHGDQHKRRVVLGIESSCDDTGVAIVTSDGEVLGEVLVSQAQIHEPWGGVVPNLARQAHQDAMSAAVDTVLQMARVPPESLDAVAVTIGPGLSLCLKVGVEKAQELARCYGLPYVGVHHMEAHALVARMEADVAFPFVCLLVSGGHNMLVTVHAVGQYTLLGSTFDDALGEAYDKVGRLLGLTMEPSYGAALEKLAQYGDPLRYNFTLPLAKRRCANYSYAGLKTAVRLAIEAEAPGPPSPSNHQVRADIAASFQRVAVQHLAERTRRGLAWALEGDPWIRSLVVAGGVAANQHVRGALASVAEGAGVRLVCPRPSLCTDNGVMIAWAAIERLREGVWQLPPVPQGPGDAEGWLDVRPRWPLTEDRDPRGANGPAQRSARKARIFPSLTELTRQLRGDREAACLPAHSS